MQQVREMANFDVSAQLPRLASIPTLVSARNRIGSRDPNTDGLRRRRAPVRPSPIADAGHAVTIQCAAEVKDLLTRHC